MLANGVTDAHIAQALARLIELTESKDEEVVGLAVEELYQRSQDPRVKPLLDRLIKAWHGFEEEAPNGLCRLQ